AADHVRLLGLGDGGRLLRGQEPQRAPRSALSAPRGHTPARPGFRSLGRMTATENPATATPRPSGLDLRYVDAGVRSQDDLYQHVNGAWIREHVIPADRPIDGAFLALRDLSEERVRDIITDAPVDSRIGAFYAS